MSDTLSTTTSSADTAPAAAERVTPTPTSSPSTGTPVDAGQSKESLLDAVLKVVPATTERDVLADQPSDTADAPDAAKSPDTVDQAEPAETDDSDIDDDEPAPADASPPLRKKMNKLLKQRREMRTELSRLQAPAQIG